MEVFQAIVIGIVQGLTEFLPISSSAHLILLPPLLGWDDEFLNSATFDVLLHAGTLVALLVYFWRDVIRLLSAAWDAVRERSLASDPDRKLAALIAVSVVPAALIGVAFEGFFDTYFRERLLLIPVLLVAGALLLLAAELVGRRDHGLDRMSVRDAATIGVAQALALFPGTSRSGITLAAGMFLGLERDAAARFSFLMGIPIIAGATLWKMRTLGSATLDASDLVVLIAGMVAAAISGLIAIRFLLTFLRTNSTMLFIGYRLVLAAIVTVLLLARG
jgi:undecaprenyl-diphosphatase